MTKNNLTWRVEQLEKNYDRMSGKLDKIMTNHLPHIQEDLASLKTRQTVATAIQVGAIMLGAAMLKYL